jgi:hypothetical protein
MEGLGVCIWLLLGLKHRCHFLMDQVDCLERTNEHLEFNDSSLGIPLEHVDAVDADAIDFYLELQHCIGRTGDFPNVLEGLVEEDVERGRKVLNRDFLSDLRRMNDRRMEDCTVCEEGAEALRVS